MGISLIFQPGLLKDTVERAWRQVIGGFPRHRNPTFLGRVFKLTVASATPNLYPPVVPQYSKYRSDFHTSRVPGR